VFYVDVLHPRSFVVRSANMWPVLKLKNTAEWVRTNQHMTTSDLELGTCKPSRFEFESTVPIRFESDSPIGKFSNWLPADCSS